MGMKMRNIFFFDNMLTPKIITLVYWFMLLVVVVSGLGTMFGGRSVFGLVYGIATIVGGVICARIFCELLIVVFKINEALQDIRQK